MRVWAAWFVLSALGAASMVAHARGSAHVIYTYPEGDASCPDEATLRGMITSQLGYEPFQAASSTKVVASIERTSGRLRGRVVLTRDGARAGERVLDASNDCASVAKALAFTVAAAIDTLDSPANPAVGAASLPPAGTSKSDAASQRASTSEQAAASGTDAASKQELASKPAVTSKQDAATKSKEPGDSAPLAFRLSIAPKVSGGIAPAASFGGAVAVGIRGSKMSLSLEARGDLPAFAPLSSGGELGTSVALGAIVPCIHLRRFVACAVIAAGSMRGEARGVAIAASDYGFYGAAGARVGAEIPLSRTVALRPELDGLVAWARPGLQFNDRTVWSAPPVSGTLGLALVFELGGGGFLQEK